MFANILSEAMVSGTVPIMAYFKGKVMLILYIIQWLGKMYRKEYMFYLFLNKGSFKKTFFKKRFLLWIKLLQSIIQLKVGGGTGRIGDPSGRTKERPLLKESDVDRNTKSIAECIERIFQNHQELVWRQKKKLHPIRYVRTYVLYTVLILHCYFNKNASRS